MPFLIDGHNLIAVMPGISLSDLDDEHALIQRLEQYARRNRRSISVYFDRGSLLAPKISTIAGVKIHFARPPRTADDALRDRIRQLGKEAPNWTVVSSDHEVRQAAKNAGARILDSQTFARQLVPLSSDQDVIEKPDAHLSPDEIDQWEQLFRGSESADE